MWSHLYRVPVKQRIVFIMWRLMICFDLIAMWAQWRVRHLLIARRNKMNLRCCQQSSFHDGWQLVNAASSIIYPSLRVCRIVACSCDSGWRNLQFWQKHSPSPKRHFSSHITQKYAPWWIQKTYIFLNRFLMIYLITMQFSPKYHLLNCIRNQKSQN